MDDTELGTVAVNAGCKILNGFHGIPVKIHKFEEIHGIPFKLTEHLLQDFQCRHGGDIFWNSPI